MDDMIRVLEMPQNDYNIPTEKSSNKYVPYRSAQYRGKTYIYVEGEETDDYVRDISSSDITSSESEYEEMDINDIYPYKSPKYKTLIEVVLKPSNKTHDAENTHIDNIVDTSDIPSGNTQSVTPSDIPTNKLTEEEWNKLKHDFISNMLQNIQKDLPNENIIDANMYEGIQGNILDVNIEEKPFITSIQDRFLGSTGQEVSYNIDWNVPKHTQIYSNITHSPKDNNLYSGTDLINDSLNSVQHVDIYDELLKRKENELFGTKHPKNTTTNRVVKPISGDPILNQLDLYDKWLDRHRDMCNQWNNKEEMLHKLKDEWNKENKEHLLYTSTHDDINKINDENYNM
ncbi:putative EMP1-like protein, partial [Plasmodium gaboni]